MYLSVHKSCVRLLPLSHSVLLQAYFRSVENVFDFLIVVATIIELIVQLSVKLDEVSSNTGRLLTGKQSYKCVYTRAQPELFKALNA